MKPFPLFVKSGFNGQSMLLTSFSPTCDCCGRSIFGKGALYIGFSNKSNNQQLIALHPECIVEAKKDILQRLHQHSTTLMFEVVSILPKGLKPYYYSRPSYNYRSDVSSLDTHKISGETKVPKKGLVSLNANRNKMVGSSVEERDRLLTDRDEELNRSSDLDIVSMYKDSVANVEFDEKKQLEDKENEK
jgi:hypothetical protein